MLKGDDEGEEGDGLSRSRGHFEDAVALRLGSATVQQCRERTDLGIQSPLEVADVVVLLCASEVRVRLELERERGEPG